MTERKKEILFQAALLALLVLLFSKILFTDKIIRAPDIINEFYWGVKRLHEQSFWKIFNINLSSAGWDLYSNSGFTNEGGGVAGQLLFTQKIIFWLFPAPANVGWYIVFHFFVGAAGVYSYCRLIGASRIASFLGGLLFAIAPENASLINAGHVMKIATISITPWAFYFLEKGYKTRRIIFFLTSAVVLTIQFWHGHWQIAYYTCLAVGVYGIARSIHILVKEKGRKEVGRLLGLNVALLVFFLTTVAISLVPLANWAKDTNRGAQAGLQVAASAAPDQSKALMDREEAMSWSLPPEEIASFIVPGLFGLSRQEAGDNPKNIDSYYWGRMVFTQTQTYMGLLPWLLLPLPLIFRRDKYTWLALSAIVVGTLFSMGKYTPFYNILFDHFPGINRFRVPKMIMFIPVMGLGVIGALGLDLLLDPAIRGTRAFKRYVGGVLMLPAALLLVLSAELGGKQMWINQLYDMISQPTRYEPQSEQLIMQRWNNLVMETGIAAALSALCGAAMLLYQRGKLAAKALPYVLLALFLFDVGRVNAKFMFLVPEPHRSAKVKPPEVAFFDGKSKEYRVLPLGGDPMPYVDAHVPVMFTSNPVQQRRWQDFLDTFNLASGMPDILNVRYIVATKDQYEQNKATLTDKYVPVFTTSNGMMILENRTVLPKAWLTPVALTSDSAQQTLNVLSSNGVDPRVVAIVESVPPIQMANPNLPLVGNPGEARVVRYESEEIGVDADVKMNSMLVLGEKYYKGWRATVDGKETEIYPVDYVLRGIYLTPGRHRIEFVFDPLPFKIGRYLTLGSFGIFALMLGREFVLRRRSKDVTVPGAEFSEA